MGITKEVQDICKDLYLPDATQVYVCREKAKEAIELHNHTNVKASPNVIKFIWGI